MMTTMAALLGGVPLALGTGIGSELRRPLGITIVGGLICQPGADAVHDAGHLPVLRPAGAAVRSAATPDRARRRRSGTAAESTRMNISAPFIQRPVATSLLTRGARAGGRRRVHAAAGLAAAAGGFPDDLSVGAACPAPARRRWPPSVATPLERQFGRIAGVTEMTSIERPRLDQHHAAVRPQPRHRRARRATCRPPSTRRAGSCRRTCRATRRYRKVNPADAPILILALTSDTLTPARRCTTRPTRSWRRSSRRSRASGRCTSAAARCPRCASS